MLSTHLDRGLQANKSIILDSTIIWFEVFAQCRKLGYVFLHALFLA